MSSPTFRPVRAASPLVRDLVDGALNDDEQVVVRSAVLAHLATLSGLWRVRQGEKHWEQAGPDGSWIAIPKVVVDGVSWYRLDERWQWRSVLPLPTPRTEAAGPVTAAPSVANPTSVDVSAPVGPTAPVEKPRSDKPAKAAAEPVPTSSDDEAPARRATRTHDRPLLRAVVDRSA